MRPEPRFDPDLAAAIDRLAADFRPGRNGLIRLGDRVDMALGQISTHPGQRTQTNLVEALVNRVYAAFYCSPEGAAAAVADGERDLTPDLAAANAGRDGASGWWREAQRSDTEVLLASGDRLHLARPDDLRPVAGFDRWHRLHRIAGSDAMQAGYYHAFGAEVPDRYDMMAGVRLYLALGAGGAAAALAAITRRFDADRVPFSLKLPRQAAGYCRTDAGVVYLPRRVAGFAVARVLEMAGDFDLGPGTPRFTRALAPGIAMADCPPGGDSFGMHRSRLLVQALTLQAAGGGRASSLAARVLAGQGIDPVRPWLEPGNADLDLPVLPATGLRRRASGGAEAGPLAAAARIGRQLVRDALTEGGRATWVGWGVGVTETGPRRAVTSAGPDLYAGTAGVALFLGRLAAATGEGAFASTALAALRHAVEGGASLGAEGGITGLPGVVWAAADLAARTGSDEAAALGASALSRWRAARAGAGSPGHDLLSGSAGTIRLLLATGGAEALSLAEAEGRALLARSVEAPEGLTWPHDPETSPAPLHGLAHGNAGVALALAGLAAATGDAGFRAGAERALAYETQAFDPATGNWPDLRLNRHGPHAADAAGDAGRAPAMLAWCNGSAGSLLAGLAVAGPGWAPAVPAAAAIAAKLTADLATPLCDCCLCHGVFGLAEVLDTAATALGRADWAATAADALAEVEARYGTGSWPCGILPERESPGLFLGLAGIGHGFLRRADPGLASVLAI